MSCLIDFTLPISFHGQARASSGAAPEGQGADHQSKH